MSHTFADLLKLADRRADILYEISVDKFARASDKSFLSKELRERGMFYSMVRSSYNEKYSWPLVTIELIDGIRDFLWSDNSLQNKSCLSVMSGKGLLEQHLTAECCDIVATDIIALSSTTLSSDFSVNECDAIKAIRTYDKDVLLMSWCPYGDSIGTKTLKFALQTGFKYIIYIGEGHGGCCATDEFFDILEKMTKKIKNVEMKSFWGVCDDCTIYESTLEKIETDVSFKSSLLNKKILSFVKNNSSLNTKSLKKSVRKYFDVNLGKKHINFLKTL
jgi:hypothetical protein